ncbi:MAG: hypothetical protein LBB09_00375, partial [Rickettsiales bacterium]|nr:hypothetical protein [Rickettsiales bacterium]
MKKEKIFERRKERNAFRVKTNNREKKPIINVFRSNKNIYAQIVDGDGKVLVAVSSKTKELAEKIKNK